MSGLGLGALRGGCGGYQPPGQGRPAPVPGVFIDTIVICSCSAMVMLLTPESLTKGLEGMDLLQTAMHYHLGTFGVVLIAVILWLFSFSTFLGILFYARSNVAYLFGDHWLPQILYKVLALVMLFVGGLAAYQFVWDLGDVGIGLMTIFNMIALIPLAPERCSRCGTMRASWRNRNMRGGCNMTSTRQADQAYYELFSVSRPFSEHLNKREDNQLADKYDHNSFFYHGQPTLEEVRGRWNTKSQGRRLLQAGRVCASGTFLWDGTGCNPDHVLSDPAAADRWALQPRCTDSQADYAQLEQLNCVITALCMGMILRCATTAACGKAGLPRRYLGERLVGCCYTCEAGEWVCMDSLLVADDSRRQYVATTLMKSIAAAHTRGAEPSTSTPTRMTPPRICMPGWVLSQRTGAMSTPAPTSVP